MSKINRVVMFLCFITTLVSSAAVPDGAWNGKQWDKKVLEQGVAKGDKDALAEWAYCSFLTNNDVRYNERLFMERAKKASEKGSPLGHFLLSKFYMTGAYVKQDLKRGAALLKKAVSQGHPMAQWKYDVFKRHGIYGIQRDPTNALANMQRAVKAGVVDARWSLAMLYASGQMGSIDYEESVKQYSIGVLKESNLACAIDVFVMAKLNKTPLSTSFSKDLIKKSEELVRYHANLGHPVARQQIGNLESIYQNPNQGLPILMELQNESSDIRIALSPNAPLERLLYLMEVRSPKRHWKLKHCSAESMTMYSAATYAFNNGVKQDHVKKLFAEGSLTLFFNKEITEEEEAFTIDLLRKMYAEYRNEHFYHHLLGKYFLIKNANVKENPKYVERGMAHLIYHSYCNTAKLDMASVYVESRVAKARDLPRGVAVLTQLLAFKHGKFYKDAKRLMKVAEAKMTPEQKQRAKVLIEEGFPTSDKFRKEAFKKLQELGDIPADWEYKSLTGEEDAEEEARVPNRFLSPVISAVPVSIFTDAESQLIEKYLAKKPLNDKELKMLAGLFLADEVKLRSLLLTQRAGKYAHQVAEMLKVLGKEYELTEEDTPLKADFGWYISFNKGKVSSDPLLIVRDPSSPTAKVGMRLGDVILKCQGHAMQSTRSRNLLMRLLVFWPKDYPLQLEIKRNPAIQIPNSNAHKYVMKKFSVSLK